MNILLFFSDHAALTSTFIFIFGAVIGSFLNMLIYRYPIMLEQEWHRDCLEQLGQSISTKKNKFNLCVPRSHCPKCRKQLSWYCNIPILSYLFLRGRCWFCHAAIPLQYFFVEMISAVLSIIVFWRFGITFLGLDVLLFTYGLIALGFIDFNHQFLPDVITFLLLWLGLIVSTQHYFTSPSDAIFAVIIGYLFLWVIAKLFFLLRKKEGMGMGDCKMLAMLGAWVGTHALLNVVLLSSASALFVVGVLIIFKKCKAHNRIPFGPFLAMGGWCTVMYGPQLNQWVVQCLS